MTPPYPLVIIIFVYKHINYYLNPFILFYYAHTTYETHKK